MKPQEHTENDWALCNQDHKIPRPRTGTRRDYLREAEEDPEWAMLRKIYPKENFSPRIARAWLYRRHNRQGLILDGDLELIYRRFCLADLPAEDHPRYDEYDRPLPPRLVLPPTLDAFLDIPTLRRLIQEAVEWNDGESTRWVENKLHEALRGRYTFDDEQRVEGLNSREILQKLWKVQGEFTRLWSRGEIDPLKFLSEGVEPWDKLARRCQLAAEMRRSGMDEDIPFLNLSEEERQAAVEALVACPYLYEEIVGRQNGDFLLRHYGLNPTVYRRLRDKFEEEYSNVVEAYRVTLLGERTRPALNEIPEGEAL